MVYCHACTTTWVTLKITGYRRGRFIQYVRFGLVAVWQTPTITFDTSYTCSRVPASHSTFFWDCTASFIPAFTNHSRKIVTSAPWHPPSPSCLLRKVYTCNRIVSSVSAFIRWTRSNAPTSPIKVCPLLINCGCDHLSTLMVISGITGARFIKQYFI